MSSVGDPGKAPDYSKLTQALNQGKRIVFNKKTQEFESVTRDQAKGLGTDDYATELSDLKTKVSEYIQNKGISDQQKEALKQAFQMRAEELKGRFVLWGGEIRDKAVQELEEFPDIISRAATKKTDAAKKAIPTQPPPSSPGPQQPYNQPPPSDLPPEYIPQAVPTAPQSTASTGAPAPKNKEEQAPAPAPKFQPLQSQAQPSGAPSEGAMKRGAGPPLGGAGKTSGGPPLPPGAGPRAPVKRKFAGEPDEPTIARGIGKGATPEKLKQEAAEIREYVKKEKEALESVDKLVEEHTALNNELTAKTPEFETGKERLENAKQNMPSLIRHYNNNESFDVLGGFRLYSKEDFDKQPKKRPPGAPPLSDANKISFATLATYSAVKDLEGKCGKKDGPSFVLEDAEGKEIIPVDYENKTKESDLKPKPDTVSQGQIEFAMAKEPLSLRETKIQKDGTLTKQIFDAQERKKEIENTTSGDFEFENFERELKGKKDKLTEWERQARLRDAALKLQPAAKVKPIAEAGMVSPEMEEQIANWSQMDDKLKNELQINPVNVFLTKMTIR